MPADAGRGAALPSPAAPLEVHLLTFGPGDRVWEKFAHNALLIRDPDTGWERVYNWGIFSFAQEDFFVRLLTGRMRYTMIASSLEGTLAHYRSAGRTVRSQRLRLGPERARELLLRVETNLRPENRDYDYDPFLDNCSTRIRDHLDAVLDGAIRKTTEGVPTGETFRSHSLRLEARVEWAYLGLVALLGQGVDRPIDAWEEMFLPMRLEAHLRGLTAPGVDGRPVALVAAEDTLYRADRPPPPARKPGFHWSWAGGGMLAGGLLALLGFAGGGGRAAARHAFGISATFWHLTAATAGLILALGWAFTGHWYVHANENVLQANPVSLLPALLVPLSVWGRRASRGALIAAGGSAGLALLGLVLQLLPGLDQVNGELIALVLPVQVGAALGSLGIHRDGVRDGRTPPAAASFPQVALAPGPAGNAST